MYASISTVVREPLCEGISTLPAVILGGVYLLRRTERMSVPSLSERSILPLSSRVRDGVPSASLSSSEMVTDTGASPVRVCRQPIDTRTPPPTSAPSASSVVSLSVVKSMGRGVGVWVSRGVPVSPASFT